MPSVRPVRDLALAALAAGIALVAAIANGSESVPWQRLWSVLSGGETGIYADVVLGLRLPRALAAFACGGLLAFAGALMQVMLRNPLADPYVLGLAGGSGAGALAAMLAGFGASSVLLGAWSGALSSVALVLAFSRQSFRAVPGGAAGDEPLRLLLTGVALATGWAALITIMLALAPDASLRGMLFWLMGDLDSADGYAPALVGLVVVVALGLSFGRDLNVLVQGADVARTLGVPVQRVRFCIMMLASAATALAVTTAGTIGFVGLIVPNAARLLVGNDQRLLLPVCALAGGALLTLADTVARSAAAPIQLPVGAVIALGGVPAFIWLLARGGPRR